MPDPVSAPPPNTSPATPPRRRRWLGPALAVSVALNLAVAGGIAGAMLAQGPMHARVSAMRDPGLGPLGPAFSREDRAAMRAGFAERRGSLRESLAADRADATAMAQALRAEPFAPEAVGAIVARMRARAHGRIDEGLAAVERHLGTLEPAARRALADRIEDTLRRAPRE
jgi:uncharacterized membrane protein